MESSARLEAFERMLAELVARHAVTAAQMERLRREGKATKATYRQFMGNKLML